MLFTITKSMQRVTDYGLVTPYDVIDQGRHRLCNALSPLRHQAIIWIKASLLSIGPLEQSSMKVQPKCMYFHCKNTYYI